ncbi:MAG: MBL fold metallo-hydrolase [Eubacteriales bacterium]|nr:MBL fold metallo-hydrolase [Eubacteriales bacterium]
MDVGGFTVTHPFARVYHIRDVLGVYMTLLVGMERALLFDTGYGLFDVQSQMRAITPLPLTVVCSHHHHDHLLGARWFSEVFLPEGEIAGADRYVGGYQRQSVLTRAREGGIRLTPQERESYLAFPMPPLKPLGAQVFELGGLRVRVWPMPGHTRDSVGLWVEEERLLLTGDNFNPVVWLFLEDSATVEEYVSTMQNALYLPFAHVLCPHAGQPVKRRAVEDYTDGLRPEVFREAQPVDIPPYSRVATRACSPAEGYTFVFDNARADSGIRTQG